MLIRQWLQLIKLLNNGNMKVGFVFGLLLVFTCCATFGTTSKKCDPLSDGGGKDDRGYERERSGSFLYI